MDDHLDPAAACLLAGPAQVPDPLGPAGDDPVLSARGALPLHGIIGNETRLDEALTALAAPTPVAARQRGVEPALASRCGADLDDMRQEPCEPPGWPIDEKPVGANEVRQVGDEALGHRLTHTSLGHHFRCESSKACRSATLPTYRFTIRRHCCVTIFWTRCNAG